MNKNQRLSAFLFASSSSSACPNNWSAYKCGFDPCDHDANSCFDIRFDPVSILFIIFDFGSHFFFISLQLSEQKNYGWNARHMDRKVWGVISFYVSSLPIKARGKLYRVAVGGPPVHVTRQLNPSRVRTKIRFIGVHDPNWASSSPAVDEPSSAPLQRYMQEQDHNNNSGKYIPHTR